MSYYLLVLVVSIANLALAAIAYLQRAKQIRGNAVREQQLALAETRNRLAETRLNRLDEQLDLLGEIRDAVQATVPPPTVGVIDVGSATVRLLVCSYDPSRNVLVQVCKRGAYLELGMEVERHGSYRSPVLARLDDSLHKLTAVAERKGCDRLAVVVTAPGRRGRNPDKLLDVVAAATGREPWLLGPEDEARLAFMGATMGRLSAAEGAFVCDVGGGSTEVALGSHAGVTASASFDVGAFALAERHFRHDPPTAAEIDAARAAAARAVTLDLDAPTRLALATGGSARALAKLTGPVVAEDELAAGLRAVIAEKQAIKNPHRRRTLPAGIVILEALHSVIGRPLTIVAGGLREGVLLHLANA